MTHKYRGSILVLSISKSVEPNEEQKSLINISLLIRNKLPCGKYIILCKSKKRVSHKLGGGFSGYLMLCLIILLRKMKYLISFIMD